MNNNEPLDDLLKVFGTNMLTDADQSKLNQFERQLSAYNHLGVLYANVQAKLAGRLLECSIPKTYDNTFRHQIGFKDEVVIVMHDTEINRAMCTAHSKFLQRIKQLVSEKERLLVTLNQFKGNLCGQIFQKIQQDIT